MVGAGRTTAGEDRQRNVRLMADWGQAGDRNRWRLFVFVYGGRCSFTRHNLFVYSVRLFVCAPLGGHPFGIAAPFTRPTHRRPHQSAPTNPQWCAH